MALRRCSLPKGVAGCVPAVFVFRRNLELLNPEVPQDHNSCVRAGKLRACNGYLEAITIRLEAITIVAWHLFLVASCYY